MLQSKKESSWKGNISTRRGDPYPFFLFDYDNMLFQIAFLSCGLFMPRFNTAKIDRFCFTINSSSVPGWNNDTVPMVSLYFLDVTSYTVVHSEYCKPLDLGWNVTIRNYVTGRLNVGWRGDSGQQTGCVSRCEEFPQLTVQHKLHTKDWAAHKCQSSILWTDKGWKTGLKCRWEEQLSICLMGTQILKQV